MNRFHVIRLTTLLVVTLVVGQSMILWGRSAALAVGVPQWPYSRACGFPLATYLAVVGVVLVAAVWGGVFSWNNRLAVAHLVSLGMLGWGLVLGASQVLPRVGYASQAASWSCSVQSPAPALPASQTDTEEAPPAGRILGHVRLQSDATTRVQTQKVPLFFLAMTVRSSQTQPHAADG